MSEPPKLFGIAGEKLTAGDLVKIDIETGKVMRATPTPYVLEFEIKGLTKMSNSLLRGHWKVKHAHAQMWKRAVWRESWHLRPPQPLLKAKLTLTRVSSAEPDFDGLVSSFKPIIDGLVEHGILENDKSANIGQPEYKWEKGKRQYGRMRVRVEAI
jgi:hypothetical protein